ncbi:hypothetical protein PV797_04880 [Clostridiaceae bacterium M8S5]|nr:hypothetical protein PV797_04880 [Clostridiaceae bacterium M8S5]
MKSVTIPAINQSYYEKMEKSEIGKQKYWYDLLLSDVEVGKKRLANIMQFPKTANELASNETAMQLIFNGRADLVDKEEIIIEPNTTNIYNNCYSVPRNKLLIITEHIVKNTSQDNPIYGLNCYNNNDPKHIIKKTNINGFDTIKTNLFYVIQPNDSIQIYSNSPTQVKHIIKGLLIDLSLSNIFIKSKYGVGKGFNNILGNNADYLSSKDTLDSILACSSTFDNICKNRDVMNFFYSKIGLKTILQSEKNIAKWWAGILNHDPSNYNSLQDIRITSDALTNPLTFKLLADYIYIDENYINSILLDADKNNFPLMYNRNMLIKTPFIEKGTGYRQRQHDDFYVLEQIGSDSYDRSHAAIYYSNEMYDLTNVNTVKLTCYNSGTAYVYIGIQDKLDESFNFKAYERYTSPITERQISINVSSLTGKHYLKFIIYDPSNATNFDGILYLKEIYFSK